MPLSEWRTTGATFDSSYGPIFCRSEGKGPALLFIHGFPTASWDWAKIWPAFTPHFRCLTLDMAGFGFSAKPVVAAYSIARQADLFEQWLRQQGIDEYACIAHDYGDTVAQELLARQGSSNSPRMTRLVLLNGGLFPETHKPLLLQKLLAGPLGPLIARLTTREKFAANMRRICTRPLSDAEIEGMWTLLLHNDGVRVLPKLIGYMAERRTHRERWVGGLQRAHIPIRLIDGMEDPISGAHMVARYRELIDNADIVELSGTGHYPQVEAPEAVIDAALPFLRN
ncbi:MAG: alpha/beta hydrolase [Betaproteobacteria bacterium]|nr:alpha/beta hydrolase [Betaproteobacteria bacterium]